MFRVVDSEALEQTRWGRFRVLRGRAARTHGGISNCEQTPGHKGPERRTTR